MKKKNYYQKGSNGISREQQEARRLGIVSGWPMFMIVTPTSYGIYDDFLKAVNDTVGMEMHYCTKYRVAEAINSIVGYHDYHFPKYICPPVKITEKNKLINIC